MLLWLLCSLPASYRNLKRLRELNLGHNFLNVCSSRIHAQYLSCHNAARSLAIMASILCLGADAMHSAEVAACA